MYSEPIDTFSECVGGYNVNFVQKQETPFSGSDPLHHLLGVVCSFPGDTDHGVCGDDDTGWTRELGQGEQATHSKNKYRHGVPSLCWTV